MTATNDWPGKPGVPINPERNGWHIVQEGDLDPECAFWLAEPWFGENQGGWKKTGTEYDFAPYEVLTWRYLGPCLTPDEVQNLRDDLASAERERAYQHGRADRNAAEYAREQAKREALQKRVAELEDFCEDYLVRFELFHITNTMEAPEDATGFLAEKARAILGAELTGGKDE